MTRRRPIVEKRRGLFRKTPEALLIEAEDGDAYAATLRLPEEVALRSALNAFAAVVGWPDARNWCAARAHEKPTANGSARQAAEALFAKGDQ